MKTLVVGDEVKLRARKWGERLLYGSQSVKPLNGGEDATVASFGMRDIEVHVEGHGFVKITIHDLESPTTERTT